MKEEVKVTTKIRPEIMQLILNGIVKAVENGCPLRNVYHFGDGELKLSVTWKEKKKKEK